MSIPFQRFTIFQADDVTPLLGTVVAGNVTVPTASTDPAAARPYMLQILELAQTEIDFTEGRTTIGQVTIEVLDKRTTASDQRTGWFTALLASGGIGQISGYRVLVEQQDASGNWYVLMNGVVGDPTLKDDYVTYQLPVRDMRERERKVKLFTASNNHWSLLPSGPVSAYGAIHPVDPQQLIPAVRGARAKFKRELAPSPLANKAGTAIVNSWNGYAEPTKEYQDFVNKLSAYQTSFDPALPTTSFVYPNVGIRWRAWGSGGGWTVLSSMPVPVGAFFAAMPSAFMPNMTISGSFDQRGSPIFVLSDPTGTLLPTENQDIEIQLTYNGPPTVDFPLLIESSFGQLLKDCYDGVYSSVPPRIPYNTSAVAAMVTNTPTARCLITEPVDDLRTWTEDNIYKPLGYAPGLDAFGKIKPLKYALPDVSVSLTVLDDTNLVSARWMHSGKDTINKIVFNYKREYAINGPVTGNTNGLFATIPVPTGEANSVAEQDVQLIFENAASIAALGERIIEYNPVTVRSRNIIADANQISGSALDELGYALGVARKFELFDRFAWGGQRVLCRAARSDANVAALTVGDWVTIGATWLPDYVAGTRNINRIGQVVKVQDLDPATRTIEILDAGPNVVPVSLPTMGTPVNQNGHVSVPMTVIPASTETRIDYAISTSQPAANAGDWLVLGRTTSTVVPLITPPLPAGVVIWVRARSEAQGKRPSAWTAAQNVTTPALTRASDVSLLIKDGSNPIVNWTPGAGSAGLRIYYQVYDSASIPATVYPASSDVVLSAGTFTLPIRLPQFSNIIVSVEPWSGWTGSAVSGSASTPIILAGRRASDSYIPPTVTLDRVQTSTDATLTVVAVDPQYRISSVEFRSKVGTVAYTGWVADATIPYSVTAALVPGGGTTLIEYRVNALDFNGTSIIVAMGTITFVQVTVVNPPIPTVNIVNQTPRTIVVAFDAFLEPSQTITSWQYRIVNETNGYSPAYTAGVGALPQNKTFQRTALKQGTIQLSVTQTDGQTVVGNFNVQGELISLIDGSAGRTTEDDLRSNIGGLPVSRSRMDPNAQYNDDGTAQLIDPILGRVTTSMSGPSGTTATLWERGANRGDGGFTDITGSLISTAKDSRASSVNTMFRYGTDGAAGVVESGIQAFIHGSYIDGSRRPITIRDGSVDVVAADINVGQARARGGFTGTTGQLVSTAVDSRASSINAHFRLSVDSTDSIVDGTGSPISGGKRGQIGLNSSNKLQSGIDAAATGADGYANVESRRGAARQTGHAATGITLEGRTRAGDAGVPVQGAAFSSVPIYNSTGDQLLLDPTLTGALTALRTLTTVKDRAQMYSSVGQVINNNTLTNMGYDTKPFDVGVGIASTGTGLITIPTDHSGLWIIHASVVWQANAVGYRLIQIVDHLGSVIAQNACNPVTAAAIQTVQDTWTLVDSPAAGETYGVQLRQTSGGNLNAAALSPFTVLEAFRIW